MLGSWVLHGREGCAVVSLNKLSYILGYSIHASPCNAAAVTLHLLMLMHLLMHSALIQALTISNRSASGLHTQIAK